ncbi:peptide MFS transporter [Sphingomonas sp.]|uniref:peptide MFS transporter n=1 Tax=Sphingomonas sp. TaxID=28214 RepID=UPI002E30E994|nr:peptide MFS transporter [Sphingomonas sp.]HEX4694289.1 peptide MFS transporter [Sphingomonas sp.]
MSHAPPTTDTGFFGHPKGLAYLAFTECWERFSYYGMTSLLTLYMVEQLFKPGHAEHVLGLGALRHLFAWHGALSDIAFASLIYGWYGGLVYFTPILGGWIADRWLGTKATVVTGALLMCAGHLAMAFDASFLIALLLLICGSGCLKGNISAQVGDLYPAAAESRRTQGYTIFSAGINVGAVLGPLTCGGIAALYGWHAGFGAAAGLMMLALIVYLAGQRHLPSGRTQADRAELPPMTADEKRRTILLVLVAAMTLFPTIAYPMIWSIGVLWVDQHVALGPVPASWFNSVDAFASIVAVPPLVAVWAWQARRRREPSDVAKIGIGALLTGASALFFVAGDLLPGAGGKTNVGWALAGFFGMGVAFLYYWPVLLALVSQAAPPSGQGDHDGRGVPVILSRQRDRRVGRQLLRPDDAGFVLDDRRRDRDCRRVARAGGGATAGARARARYLISSGSPPPSSPTVAMKKPAISFALVAPVTPARVAFSRYHALSATIPI